jgi:hypothetical protein
MGQQHNHLLSWRQRAGLVVRSYSGRKEVSGVGTTMQGVSTTLPADTDATPTRSRSIAENASVARQLRVQRCGGAQHVLAGIDTLKALNQANVRDPMNAPAGFVKAMRCRDM